MGMRHAAALALISAASAGISAQPAGPTPLHTLAVVRTYVTQWQDTLTNLYHVAWVEELRAFATYSNHRLFRTAGTIIVPSS